VGKEPKGPTRNDNASDESEGDFDLSGFADDTGGGRADSGKSTPAKKSEDEPKRGRKIIGKGLPPNAGKAPREGQGPHGEAPRRGDGPARGGFSDRKPADRGPAGPRSAGAGGPRSEGPRGEAPNRGGAPRPPRGGWEKLPQRENFRGRDEGFVPRGPRNAGSAGQRNVGPAGPRGAGPRNAGPGGPRNAGPARFPDRGGPRSAGPGAPPVGSGARDVSGPRSYGYGPGGPRIIERVGGGGDRKPASAEIKPFLPLKTDKGRWKESQFLLEGSKNIADALSVGAAIIQTVFITEGFEDHELLALIKKNRIQAIQVSADDMINLSDTETPQGILAVANFATLRPDYALARYVTLLDAVQDPGNVGAILRTSLALGMDAVILGKGTCDPYNPKVVRSSVGALLRLPFETGEEIGSKIGFLRQKGFSIVATSSHAPITLDQAKLRKKVALIMGNEGAGTGATYLDMADAVVKIPLKNKVESLNVGVAHGILSYQLIHGRT
jgi:RNA methyltransferase, TrmH family